MCCAAMASTSLSFLRAALLLLRGGSRSSQRRSTPARGIPPSCGRRGERLLFQRRRDGRERRIQVGAERRDHGDDGDRNTCGQQAVFDGGRRLLIGKKIPQQCAHDLVLSQKFSRPSRRKSCSSARVPTRSVNLRLRLNGTVTRFAKILRNKNVKSARRRRPMTVNAPPMCAKGPFPQARRDSPASIFRDFDRVRKDIPN